MLSSVQKSKKKTFLLESQKKTYSGLFICKIFLIIEGVEKENILIEVGFAKNSIEKRPVFCKLINKTLKAKDLLLIISKFN